jgi:hypothetical protein
VYAGWQLAQTSVASDDDVERRVNVVPQVAQTTSTR